MKKIEENQHIRLSIRCPKESHANFYIIKKTGNFVCMSCGKDFTKEAKKIYKALKQTFEK